MILAVLMPVFSATASDDVTWEKGYTGGAGGFSNPAVENVPEVFGRITSETSRLRFFRRSPNGEVLVPDIYSVSREQAAMDGIAQKAGFKGPFAMSNHFQSAKLISNSSGSCPLFLFTAGDKPGRTAHLFLAGISAETVGIGSESVRLGSVLRKFEVSRGDFWHAGGMDVSGKILAFPLEALSRNPVDSRIAFYSIQDPFNPVKLGLEIEIPGSHCMAVAMTRLEDGHFLLVSFWKTFDLFLSRSRRIEEGFSPVASVPCPEAHPSTPGALPPISGGFQNISLINDRDGRIFLVGAFNPLVTSPVLSGDNVLSLFQVRFSRNGGKVELVPVQEMKCDCGPGDWYGNFNAGATVSAVDSGHLACFAVYHWLVDRDFISCSLFSTDPISH